MFEVLHWYTHFHDKGEKVKPINKEMVTVYFSDIVGFTVISSSLSASKVSGLLDRLYCKFDLLAEKYCVYKIDTIGDGLKIGCTFSISFKRIDTFSCLKHMLLAQTL